MVGDRFPAETLISNLRYCVYSRAKFVGIILMHYFNDHVFAGGIRHMLDKVYFHIMKQIEMS